MFAGTSLLGTAEHRANAFDDLTALQKFDALKERGIITGLDNGDAALDQNMNRAQFARVSALILGLEGIGTPDTKVVTEKPFDDVNVDAWYVEEIAAVKEAGIMVGSPDGTFNPRTDMTIQEMAVVTARVLDIQPVEDAQVEGAADWAAGYIQALKNADIEFPTNYTVAATRADLVTVTFQTDSVITSMKNEKRAEELRIEEERIQEEELKKAEEAKLAAEEQAKVAILPGTPTSSFNPVVTNPIPVPVSTVTTPIALPAGGEVESGTLVSLSATSNATIYYTTDGSTPTRTNGLVYSAPIVVDRAITIRAFAVHDGMTDSSILSASYTIIVYKSALDWINEASESGDWSGIDVATFDGAGVTGVTADNLFAIQYYLEIDAAPFPRTGIQMQAIVDQTVSELMVEAIFSYLNPFGGGSRPTLAVFEIAGITGVDASNLDAILDELSLAYQESRSNPFGTPMSTKQDIQNVIDLYNL